jgi:hypothetical protein
MNVVWKVALALGVTPLQILRRIGGRIVYRGRPW